MSEIARFRIKPDKLEAALADFRAAGFEPKLVLERPDSAISVEFRDLSEQQLAEVVSAFRPDYSAILGVIGGSSFED